jgi:hypothetical protein
VISSTLTQQIDVEDRRWYVMLIQVSREFKVSVDGTSIEPSSTHKINPVNADLDRIRTLRYDMRINTKVNNVCLSEINLPGCPCIRMFVRLRSIRGLLITSVPLANDLSFIPRLQDHLHAPKCAVGA